MSASVWIKCFAGSSADTYSCGREGILITHITDDSIVAAIREYLAVLDDHDVDGCRHYFASLYENQPGSWAAAARNIRFGLDHFPSHGRVLDLGCGLGMQAYVFAKHDREVLGIDLNYDWINAARAAADELGAKNLEFLAGDVTEEIRNLTAGAIWMHRAIGHIQYLPEFFRRAHTTLRPDGALVFMTSNATSRAIVPGMRRGQYSIKRLSRLLEDARFDVQDLTYQGYLTALPPRYRPSNIDTIEPRLSQIPLLRAMGGSFSMAAYAR